jgi:hypothetical protein
MPLIPTPPNGNTINPAMEIGLIYTSASKRHCVQEVINISLVLTEKVSCERFWFTFDDFYNFL